MTAEEERIIIHKGTEAPFSGKYWNFYENGVYTCKQCGAELYKSHDKFDSHCGWPSFDDEIQGAIKRQTDADGMRTEILCANCGAHLGHVFEGEHLTDKDIRHCVNSLSLNFIPEEDIVKSDTAIFAGGCFWGVEYFFKNERGVIETTVGYTGGHIENPTYEEVCSGKSGHIEAIQVIFNPKLTNFEKLAKLFFEIHDPSQWNRQGPDYGEQYRSVIFYTNEEQKEISMKLIDYLKVKGLKVVTELRKASVFWEAEEYHQDYYDVKGTKPYCHFYTKRFE
ncbi:MAG: methionine sulfoxide reductase [Ignavibacteria bacterium GWF2_33_9]|nr:MAG: methionine sulfoxide reductase [Ignavibacteria bacterium GWF2_33_9]